MDSRIADSALTARNRQRAQSLANVAAAALFVLGCIGFYSERLQTAAITAFLVGSILFLLVALSSIAPRDRASRRRPAGVEVPR